MRIIIGIRESGKTHFLNGIFIGKTDGLRNNNSYYYHEQSRYYVCIVTIVRVILGLVQ